MPKRQRERRLVDLMGRQGGVCELDVGVGKDPVEADDGREGEQISFTGSSSLKYQYPWKTLSTRSHWTTLRDSRLPEAT